jgi:hypothetical protein
VIINAHNFTPAVFSPIVNGKTPTYAWIPSRDTTGNGTTTLSDLVDSKPGTLTNFALTGSTSNWVSDTDAGGVRALDFDGSNDRIAFASGNVVSTATAFSISAWVKTTNLTTNLYPKVVTLQCAQGVCFEITLSAQGPYSGVAIGGSSVWGQFRNNIAWVNSIWQHLVVTYSGASATTAGSYRIWVNNAVATPIAAGAYSGLANATSLGAPASGGVSNLLLGRLDDIRFFSATVLDASDVSFLYASGLGRGVSA